MRERESEIETATKVNEEIRRKREERGDSEISCLRVHTSYLRLLVLGEAFQCKVDGKIPFSLLNSS